MGIENDRMVDENTNRDEGGNNEKKHKEEAFAKEQNRSEMGGVLGCRPKYVLTIIFKFSALYFPLQHSREDVMLEQILSVARICENVESLDTSQLHFFMNEFDKRPLSNLYKTSNRVSNCTREFSNNLSAHEYSFTDPVSNIDH